MVSVVGAVRAAALAVALIVEMARSVGGESWCIAWSHASDQALQTALDYACGQGADCTPIQSNGLCYLPNTLQAHASYAFNSYYQRKGMGPGSCDFSGTAAVAMTDPSYGSCTFPSSASAAGGNTPATPSVITNNPSTNTPTPFSSGNGGGATPGLGPVIPNTETSEGGGGGLISSLFLLLFSFVFQLLYVQL